MPMMTTSARVDRVHYELDGPADGIPVLMIHGLGGTTSTWSAMLVSSSSGGARGGGGRDGSSGGDSGTGSRPSGCRVVRLDLPGSGHSTLAGDQPALTIADHVRAVRRVAAAVGLAQAHVVGHSMGCIVAQHLAAEDPGFVSSLALYGPLLALPEAARPVILARGQRARDDGLAGMQAITNTLLETAVSARSRRERPAAWAFVRESLMRQPAAGYAANCDALAGSQPADVAGIHCPVLLVTGDDDRVAPPVAVQAMATRFAPAAAARVIVLPGCGHWHPVEQPETCQRLLLDHLQRAVRHQQEQARRSALIPARTRVAAGTATGAGAGPGVAAGAGAGSSAVLSASRPSVVTVVRQAG